jgi:chemotaxis protein methyltransferase CheR
MDAERDMTAQFTATLESAIDDHWFGQYQKLILAEAGIRLNDTKKALLVGRLSRRLRELGIGFAEYYRHVTAHASELTHMLDLVTTNETHFFREPKQFEFLEREVIPTWQREAAAGEREPVVRVWSAGCSSGEEPYSVAMLLAAHLPGWRIDILATDISTRVLNKASAGVYPQTKSSEIPQPLLQRFMMRGIGRQAGTMKVHASLREMVQFRHVNLADPNLQAGGPFDVVLCRNVMIYFEADVRTQTIRRLIQHVAHGGYFLVGHAETLHGFAEMASVQPSIWKRR